MPPDPGKVTHALHVSTRAVIGRPAADVAALWDRSPSLRREYVLAESSAVILGALLIVGGYQRMASPAFDVMREFGGHLPWGLLLIGGGVVLTCAQRVSTRACHWALRCGAGVYVVIALSMGIAAVDNPDASWWGATLFALVLAAGHLSDAADYPHRRPDQPREVPR